MIGIRARQYLVFPWADDGNLWDLWKERDSHKDRSYISRRYIPDIVGQLVGLAGALAKLHNFKHGKPDSYRHGDLKPENILIFERNQDTFLGIWKLADLGLTKYHTLGTEDRACSTSDAVGGTISYQPPEAVRSEPAPVSRLYDIWSMGCIILQLVTWLLYGTEKIKELTRETRSVFTQESSYWRASWTEDKGFHNVEIHPSIKRLIHEMRRDLKISQALLDLLSIVEDKLLVIKLPHSTTRSQQGCRANAEDLYHSLRRIQAACNDSQAYWLPKEDTAKQISNSQLPQEQISGTEKGTYVSPGSSPHQLEPPKQST